MGHPLHDREYNRFGAAVHKYALHELDVVLGRDQLSGYKLWSGARKL